MTKELFYSPFNTLQMYTNAVLKAMPPGQNDAHKYTELVNGEFTWDQAMNQAARDGQDALFAKYYDFAKFLEPVIRTMIEAKIPPTIGMFFKVHGVDVQLMGIEVEAHANPNHLVIIYKFVRL